MFTQQQHCTGNPTFEVKKVVLLGGTQLCYELLNTGKVHDYFLLLSTFTCTPVKYRHLKRSLDLFGFKKIFSEMEVTEIILVKVSRLCHLSSHSPGFLSRQ
jgi:hypothetical protein